METNRIGGSAEDEVRQAFAALARAQLERDVRALARLVHREFLGVDARGELLDRDALLEGFATGTFVVRTLVVEEQHVRVCGETGVVTATSTTRGRTPQGEFEQRLHFTEVYVMEDGEWRLFASHVTPLRRTAGFHT